MNQQNPEIKIREIWPGEFKFIYSSWLKSYKSSEFCEHIDPKIYFRFHHALIERFITRGHIQIALCDGVIVAWLAYEFIRGEVKQQIVQFAYTKTAFRRMGLQKQLLAAAGIDLSRPVYFTHLTNPAKFITKKDAYKKFVYNPYFIS